jgi:hypothetical protein
MRNDPDPLFWKAVQQLPSRLRHVARKRPRCLTAECGVFLIRRPAESIEEFEVRGYCQGCEDDRQATAPSAPAGACGGAGQALAHQDQAAGEARLAAKLRDAGVVR